MKTRALLIVGLLVAATCAAMAFSKPDHATPRVSVKPAVNNNGDKGVISLNGELTRNKIHKGGKGTFGLVLTMTADEIPMPENDKARAVDMVVVLDRSGSMGGRKIQDAKRAVRGLINQLGQEDRFALVTYSNDVFSTGPMVKADRGNRSMLLAEADSVTAGGGTNLGAGLARGVNIVCSGREKGRMGKVILISDGKANQGVTDPARLSEMASGTINSEFSVSTVGVGYDFNEELMASISDGGRGAYYFLENPNDFLAVFTEEFRSTRAVAATSVQVRVPMPQGLELVSASGYPVKKVNGAAVFDVSDMFSGRTRDFYLTFKANSPKAGRKFDLSGITASYVSQGEAHSATCADAFLIACVDDEKEAIASIDKPVWEKKVVNSDYSNYRQSVARSIREGKRDEAVAKIRELNEEISVLNNQVGSDIVAGSLKETEQDLMDKTEDAFTGTQAEQIHKQKSESKKLHYEGRKWLRGSYVK